MYYSGDDKSKVSKDELSSKILRECLKADVKIIDELYCQLCKQTFNNQSKQSKSVVNYWELFSIVCGSLCPSDELKPYLFTYFSDTISSTPNKEIKLFAKDCKERFSRTVVLSINRNDIPTSIEYSAIRNHDSIIIRVYLLNNKSYLIKVDSFTTIKDLKEMMNNILDIRPQHRIGYSIFQTDDFISIFYLLKK